MAALEPVTAQRVARLKSNTASTSTPVVPTPRTTSSSSRLTSQTVSSMQKQSDTSLRSRNQLPTIAGSPSVGTNGTSSSQTLKESSRELPSSLMNSASGYPKETPTKIPRISSRTSAAGTPPLKVSGSILGSRRQSVNVTGLGSTSTNPSPTGQSASEFGVMDNADGAQSKTISGPMRHSSIRASPSTNSTSRVPRQSSTSTSTSGGILQRKSNRESMSFTGIRKSSTSSITSLSTPAAATEPSHHRFSALSPSKGLKLLSPKISLSATRASNSSTQQNIHQAMGSPSSSRQSLSGSTPSPAPTVDDEELAGDEEMLHYIRRQHAKKLATGSTQEELDAMLHFPEPIPPGTPASPNGQ